MKPTGQHDEGVPRPDDGAVVGSACEGAGMRRVGAKGGVGDEDADGGGEAGGEGSEDGGGKTVEGEEILSEGGWVGRMDQVGEEEKAEA